MIEQFDTTKATLIKVDGTTIELEPRGKKFTYEEIREAIGNIIEPVCLNMFGICPKEYRPMNLICDEEGAINGSGLNVTATRLFFRVAGPYSQPLYGNVIFMPNKLFNVR